MRVIKPARVHAFAGDHPDAGPALTAWLDLTRLAAWKSLQDVRRTYAHADGVRTASGRTVTVFNIAGNKYRLIVAIHYNRQTVFVLRFLTHAEYAKDRWKREL
jgi:mRNA interferase HigB